MYLSLLLKSDKERDDLIEHGISFHHLGPQTALLLYTWNFQEQFVISAKVVLRLITCNRLVNLGISKQQHLYLKTKNLI